MGGSSSKASKVGQEPGARYAAEKSSWEEEAASLREQLAAETARADAERARAEQLEAKPAANGGPKQPRKPPEAKPLATLQLTTALEEAVKYVAFVQRGPGCGAAEQELLAKVGELLQSAPLVGLAEARSKDTTIAGKLRKLDTVTKNDKEMKAYIESQFVDESAKHAHNRELARSRWAKAQRMIVIANRIRRGSMDRGANAAAPGAAPAAAPGVLKRKPSMVGIPQKHLRVEMSEEEMQLALSVKEEIDGASWDADILAMASVLRLPMTYIVHRVLRKVGAASVLGVSDDTINLFLEELEMGYRKENPYHNGTHAADVAYTTYLMLEHGVRKAANLSSLQAVACILAAVGHDFRHPGINNNFLVHQRDDLAIVYNDKSVLEQMHLTEFFKLLKRPECNVFSKLSRAQYTEVRKAIIQMVLATDMVSRATALLPAAALRGRV